MGVKLCLALMILSIYTGWCLDLVINFVLDGSCSDVTKAAVGIVIHVSWFYCQYRMAKYVDDHLLMRLQLAYGHIETLEPKHQ